MNGFRSQSPARSRTRTYWNACGRWWRKKLRRMLNWNCMHDSHHSCENAFEINSLAFDRKYSSPSASAHSFYTTCVCEYIEWSEESQLSMQSMKSVDLNANNGTRFVLHAFAFEVLGTVSVLVLEEAFTLSSPEQRARVRGVWGREARKNVRREDENALKWPVKLSASAFIPAKCSRAQERRLEMIEWAQANERWNF